MAFRTPIRPQSLHPERLRWVSAGTRFAAELLGWGIKLAGAACMVGLASTLCMVFWLGRRIAPR